MKPDEKGEFDYLIGSTAKRDMATTTLTAADLNTTQPVFIELALVARDGSAQVLLPRQRMASVGFALQAADAAVDERFVNVAGDMMLGPLQILGPNAKLAVGGMIETTSGGYKFPDATTQITAGIGAISHNATLTGNGTSGMPLGVAVPLFLSVFSAQGAIRGSNSSNGPGVSAFGSSGAAVEGSSSSGPGVRAFSQSGNLFEGIGGVILRFRVRNDGQVRSNVGFTTPALDFAEMMEVDESSRPAAEAYQPGDVLIISPETGKLTKCQESYCPLVAGVYSTKPGFVGGQGIEESSGNKVPLALVGQVPCKVTTENGPIQIGDLLDVIDARLCDERHRPGSDAGSDCGQGARASALRHRDHSGARDLAVTERCLLQPPTHGSSTSFWAAR